MRLWAIFGLAVALGAGCSDGRDDPAPDAGRDAGGIEPAGGEGEDDAGEDDGGGPDESCPGEATERSGLDGAIRVDALSDPQIVQLCCWGVRLQGGVGAAIECEDGPPIEIDGPHECIVEDSFWIDCAATVTEFEACARDIQEDPCVLLFEPPPSCAPVVSCRS